MANAVHRKCSVAKKSQGAMGKIVALSVVAMASFFSQGAWYDNPVVRASAVIDAATQNSDPHYINKSADDGLLMVDLNSWEKSGAKTVLFSMEDLKSASGDVHCLGKTVVDAFGNSWKGGAVSADLKVMIPGNGLESATGLVATDQTSWQTGDGLYPLTIPDSHKLDGMDFGTGSTYLYSNADSGSVLYRWTLPARPYSADVNALTLSASKQTSATRIRNISVYHVNGRELVYYGEGSGTSGRIWAMDVTDANADNWTEHEVVVPGVFGAFKDITNVKLSNEDSGRPVLYALSDAGKLAVCLLKANGTALEQPLRTFQKGDIYGYANVYDASSPDGKFRNFEVAKDGSCAFFVSKTASGKTSVNVVSARTEPADDDSYIEFTGTQCVDTGYFVSGQTAVVADFQMVDATTAQQLVWSAGTKMWSRLYVNGSKLWAWSCQNWDTGDSTKDSSRDNTSTGKTVDTDRVVATVDGFHNRVTLEKNGAIWYASETDRTVAWADLPHTETSSSSLKLGYRFEERSGAVYARMKLFSFKIYEAGELVRDYIPATRDGIVGLYDRKNGGFVYDTRVPVGTGEHALVSGGSLPDFPCTDAYVESDGTSGLNARFIASTDMKLEVDFAYTDLTQQQRVFGASSKPSFFIDQYSKFAFTGNDGVTCTSTLTADKERHTAVFDNFSRKMSIYTGATESWSETIAEPVIDSPQPFALFANMHSALNSDDQGFKFRHPGKVRIYGARFYRSDNLVYDYRPCVKGGIAGLRDALTGDFVCGENVDAFTAGGDVERLADDPYVQLTGNNANAGEGKWINTGYYPGPKSKIVLDYSLADNYPGSGEWFLMCAWTPADGANAAERLNFEANQASAVQWKNGTGMVWSSVTAKLGSATKQRNVRRQLCYDAAKGTCTLVTAGFTNATATSEATLTRTMGGSSAKALRLGGDTTATPQNYAPLKIYGLKIYEDEELVHDFVPYVQNGIVGLRDARTGDFVANEESLVKPLDCGGAIAGTGGFEDAYVEFTGAQTIDTGFYPTKKTRVVADFQMTSLSCNPQQFVWSSNNEMCQRVYTQGNGNLGWFAGWNAAAEGCGDFGVAPDHYRLVADIDGPTQTGVLRRNGVELKKQTMTRTTGTSCTTTMKIGSRFAYSGSTWNFASMKLYGFRVYEDGRLERDYVPYVQEGVVGLWDKVHGTFCPNIQNGAPLKISPTGRGSVLKPLENVRLSFGGEVTLSGQASMAVGYQWYVNGVAVVGATGDTFTVAWRRSKAGADVVSVVPYYDVFGIRTAGEAETAVVSYRLAGMMLLLR